MHLAHNRERDRSILRRTKASCSWGAIVLATSMSVLGGGAVAAHAAPQPSSQPAAANNYQFRTLNNNNDTTFNQLLGINKRGTIAGYFGSGAAGHPNKGYVLRRPYGQGNYTNENFPGSVQTQVTGLNDNGVTVGFWADQSGANFGFYKRNGKFHQVNFPVATGTTAASPAMSQLLGVNDRNVAVGFTTDSAGNSHGYTYNIRTKKFKAITISGSTSVTAAAINRKGDIAGFDVNANGVTDGFLLSRGKVTTLAAPGASQTMATGINDSNEVVGVYTVGTGNAAVTHGFTWTSAHGFTTVDDPNGVGTTTVNGVNDRGQLVGFYTDSNGNTDGMLATPSMTTKSSTTTQSKTTQSRNAHGWAHHSHANWHHG